MLDLALLGCGGGMPIPDRFLSSLLMNYRGRKILIDCGEGTQVSMKMLGWGFKSIDIICITHIHGDHIVGLPGLLSTIGNSGREEVLTIIGPEGIKEVISGLRTIVPYLPYNINIIENPKNSLKIRLIKNSMEILKEYSNDFMESRSLKNFRIKKETNIDECEDYNDILNCDIEISTLELEHSSPCIGYKFYINRKPKFSLEKAERNNVPKSLWSKLQNGENIIYEGIKYNPNMVMGKGRRGIKLSYITDTRPIDSIVEFIKSSDLFICEGTYGYDEDLHKAIKNKHMTFREAAKLAIRGNVSELMLTHFSPSMMEPENFKQNAIEVFPNTVIGKDRFIKTLCFKE
ncbi:MAG: ribonuclease Z [Clostridium botulinum]|jgi:ribonuclease Z|uniref:Ribonuclease Z n=2 Tax=Clostridium tepidum TaxID=1962263 RepID=A0A1S9I0W9_9CLOT|nr:ribonuclease Z [Clostridium tepidum]MDU6877444.1 ribonuclease Z [Clostridium botulinum]OOO62666.1 ribonuclease Z [Clostridium tepidum]OOO63919.1 ribonuclease Z [Clostridium tepidum]